MKIVWKWSHPAVLCLHQLVNSSRKSAERKQARRPAPRNLKLDGKVVLAGVVGNGQRSNVPDWINGLQNARKWRRRAIGQGPGPAAKRTFSPSNPRIKDGGLARAHGNNNNEAAAPGSSFFISIGSSVNIVASLPCPLVSLS